MLITSLENDKIKKCLKLKEKKYRDEYNEFIVEGEHLVIEAYKQGLIKELILEIDEVFPLAGIENIIYLPMDIIKKYQVLKHLKQLWHYVLKRKKVKI